MLNENIHRKYFNYDLIALAYSAASIDVTYKVEVFFHNWIAIHVSICWLDRSDGSFQCEVPSDWSSTCVIGHYCTIQVSI
jgi:hypothetical protein